MNRTRLATLALALLATASLATSAFADPHCRHVRSRVTITAAAENHCGSAINLCATTTYRGQLRGTSNFVGTGDGTTPATFAAGAVILVGSNEIDLAGGHLSTTDVIVLSTQASGEFSEVDTIVGGTGAYANATGVLTATGTFVNGIGEGELEGVICTP